MTPAVLTISQAAEVAQVATHELAELVEAGACPAVTIGATTVIPTRAFDEWLNDQALTCWRIRGELAAAGVWLEGLR